ncbi:MAG: hypothetical protein ACTHJ0_13605 [Flavipsychrobacter sp.]
MKYLTPSFFCFFICISFLLHHTAVFAQANNKAPYVETINKAEQQGITIDHLDSLYMSAVHVDSNKAVFKSEAAADSLAHCYNRFIADFGKYLNQHNFKWAEPTRCWNRIYFHADGSVDYYLFSFKTNVSEARTTEYKKLFRDYALTHKIGIAAPCNFAQCSPVLFTDK